MSCIKILRDLIDVQQFTELNTHAERYWAETQDCQVLPLLAIANIHLGDQPAFQQIIQQIDLNREQLDADARIDLAAVYCLMQQIPQAVELLEAEYQQHPQHALLLARLAWCKMMQEQVDQALQLYQQSAQLEPQRLPVWITLVGLHLQQKNYAEAQQCLISGIAQLEQQYDQLPEQVAKRFSAQFRHVQLEIWIVTDNQASAEEWLDERRQDLDEETWVSLVSTYATLLAGYDLHAEAEENLRSGLKHYPHNLGLIGKLAELAQIQGRSYQAVQLLKRAIRLAKQQNKPEAPYWIRLASTSLHNMTPQARKAAEKAVELVNEMTVSDETPPMMITQLGWQAKNALAQVESQEQHFELAEALFDEILQENPWFVPALQGLGQQQMLRGNIDQAIELYEKIKAIDPAQGYSALINARQFPDDEETLATIERAARRPGLEGQVRSGLLLQLASAWEKRQQFNKAFELANESNTASKKRLSYDAKAHRNQCARIRNVFRHDLYQHRKECGVDSTLPVFVLGMPRSGTTLVEQIIAGHSKIFGAGELGVIPSRVQGLNRWERHVGSGRRYPDCIDDLTPYMTQGIANGILDELRELAAEDKPEALHVVDKLPHNFENIGLIKFFFPNAKIISVRRDPRDIAISNYFTDYQAKHGGMGFAYDLTWIGEQLADHNMLMHHWNQVFPGEILEINYEEVVEDLEGSARKLLDYIGVEWEEQVLEFNKLDRPVKTASVWQVRQPIYKTSKAKWMRYKNHLKPLIKGTNARIEPDPITDRLILPVPGFLQTGVDLFHQGKLDEAEMNFKKMLHHNPNHAACQYMVGLVYCRKGHIQDAIPLMQQALDTCPWKKEWRENLHQAYVMTGQQDKADQLNLNKSEKNKENDEWETDGFADE